MITIVGATGGTGSIVARTLLARGIRVRAISRSEERLQPLMALGAEPALIESILDEAAMAHAFHGADAVYTMVPPTSSNTSYGDAGRVLAMAVAKAGVPHMVNLSALGAHRTGVGGHLSDYVLLEGALDRAGAPNVLHLRPGFFMTSFYAWIEPIIRHGQVSGLFRGDLGVPRIAARDIAGIAADALIRLDFKGKSARELHGQRDLSMDEAAKIIGASIGNTSLRYVQKTPQEWLEVLVSRGLTVESARHMIEMYTDWNNGTAGGLEKRSATNTTPTSFETFVAEDFLPRFTETRRKYDVA